MKKKILLFLLFLMFLVAAVGVVGLLWGYHYYSRDLPNFTSMDEYVPPAASTIFAADGTPVGEFYVPSERRYPVTLSEIPLVIRNAFLAAEDASFYKHPGIDIVSIIRAAFTPKVL